MLLAGGLLMRIEPFGDFVSYNVTSDKQTGLGNWTDDQIKQVITRGTRPDGHVAPHTVMPWANFSSWTEEDRHAVVVYLRSLPRVRHQIPEPIRGNTATVPGAIEQDYAFKDYGTGK